MTAPAGPCEWCGGPQWWTVVSDVMYVKCQAGCISLFPSERFSFLPPEGELLELDDAYCSSHVELNGGRRVEPYEGGDAGEKDGDNPGKESRSGS